MKIKLILALSLIVFSVACAKRPDAIVPVDIPMAAYSNLNCQSLLMNILERKVILLFFLNSRMMPQPEMPLVCF